MAVKSSGSLSITTDIVGEFGGQAPHSLSEYYRNGGEVPSNNTSVPTSGEISFSNFYGAVDELVVTISANTTNANMLTLITNAYGAPTTPGNYRLIINSGVTVGSSTSTAALTIGDFPNGSIINIENNGTIVGRGGTAGALGTGATGHTTAPSGSAGTSGGDAIYATYADQTMNIINNGNIYGGGGGGGGGAGGGKGGDGRVISPTTLYTPQEYSTVAPATFWQWFNDNRSNSVLWRGSPEASGFSDGTTNVAITPVGANGFPNADRAYRGTLRNTFVVPPSTSKFGPIAGYTQYRYNVYLRYYGTTTTLYDGGNGGPGGVGGVGQGYNQSNTSGAGGSAGATGPGPAGNGGTGGTGGPGGTYGVSGSSGGNGNAGTAGNYPPGASSGGTGGSGGSAGRYLVKGSSTVNLSGSGTVLGGLA